MSQKAYEQRLEQRIIRHVTSGRRRPYAGAVSFERICRSCAGAFPSEVAAAVRRLVDRGLPISVDFGESNARVIQVFGDGMPEPHPAEYEWRFSPSTARSLARQARTNGANIVCLGSPTVFLALLASGAKATLIDQNPLLKDALPPGAARNLISADLNAADALSIVSPEGTLNFTAGEYDVAIVDPPWYPAHTLAWLAAAAMLVRQGGTILCTLFPVLVRPSAVQEREAVLRRLAGAGTYRIRYARIEYVTPVFESETLAAQGLMSLPKWRLGDLLVARVHLPQAFANTPHPAEPAWKYFQFGHQVVAFREIGQDGDSITATSPYDNGSVLLKSVSARDTVRGKVNFWTSRNRGMVVRGGRRVEQFLTRLATGASPRQLIGAIATSDAERCALEHITAVIGW